MTLNDIIVSSESENLILVDENDNPVGEMQKGQVHDGQGVLHRAFSILLFNDKGEMLLQQRSAEKRLWPLYWSNSCCSHPRTGEDMDFSTQRRLQQELGLEKTPLTFLYKFQYHAPFGDLGAEHELCHVYIGQVSGTINANPNEIESWRFVAISELEKEMRDFPERFTPWFQMEWEHIKTYHQNELSELGVQV